MVINRDIYLNRLIKRKNNGLIKIITGVRRCGKSYLLFNLFYDHLIGSGVSEDNIIAIPLDDDDYAQYCDPHRLYEYIKARIKDSKQNYYVFIDEAQYAISKEEMKNPDVPIRLYGVLVMKYILRHFHSQSSIRYQVRISRMPGRNIYIMADCLTYWRSRMRKVKAHISKDLTGKYI